MTVRRLLGLAQPETASTRFSKSRIHDSGEVVDVVLFKDLLSEVGTIELLKSCKDAREVVTALGLEFLEADWVVELVSVVEGAQGNTW